MKQWHMECQHKTNEIPNQIKISSPNNSSVWINLVSFIGSDYLKQNISDSVDTLCC